MRVQAEISGRLNIHIGKVAATAAGHQDFTAAFAIIQQQHAQPRLARLRCTKHSRRSGANYNGIKPFHTTFLISRLSGIVNFHAGRTSTKIDVFMYIIERYRITLKQVKSRQEENQKVYISLCPRR